MTHSRLALRSGLLLLACLGCALGAEEVRLTKVYQADGASIEAGFVPDQSQIILGQPVFITFTVANRSEKPYSFFVGGDNRGSVRHNNFRITAVDADGKPVKDPYSYQHHGGKGNDVTLAKGQTYTERLFLGHWCALERPGEYAVTCQRKLGDIGQGQKSPPVEVVTDFRLKILPYDRQAIRKVIADLGKKADEENKQTLYEAALGLSQIADEEVIPHLAALVAKGDYVNKVPAVAGLARFVTDAAADALLPALRDSDQVVRQAAGDALARIKKTDRDADALLKELADESGAQRALAARALGATKSRRALEPLVKAMDDPESQVRCAAAEALGALGEKDAIAALKQYLRDPDMAMRVAAVKGLQGLGEPLDVDCLVSVIRGAVSVNDQSFHEAIRLVRLYGGERAARALASCLKFDDASARSSYNVYLILAIEYSPNGKKYYEKYKHDPNQDGTPDEIANNRRILDALESWVKEKP